MTFLTALFHHPVTRIIFFSFLVFSWPFFYYPLTDGDISNWTGVARNFQHLSDYFTGGNDQGHGPLLAWGTSLFIWISPKSFYLYNLFNLLTGLAGIWLTYFFTKKLWDNETLAVFAAFIFANAAGLVYLARTPMYDLPATIAYFFFGAFYYLYLLKGNRRYFAIALLSIAIGSLSRFSICLGLAGIFMVCTSLIYRRSLLLILRDGCLIVASVLAVNLPWIIGQYSSHGSNFLSTFIYDNTGRFIKSTRVDAKFRTDFYAFIIYTLIGLLPFTFYLVATMLKKHFWQMIRENKTYQTLVAGFLPCLILFSLSGHTKLFRYGAYIFPFLIILLAHHMMEYDINDENYRKKCSKYTIWTGIAVALILGGLIFQFPAEVAQAKLLAAGIILLIYALLTLAWVIIYRRYTLLKERPVLLHAWFSIVYIIFFTILAIEYQHAPFLQDVRNMVWHTL